MKQGRLERERWASRAQKEEAKHHRGGINGVFLSLLRQWETHTRHTHTRIESYYLSKNTWNNSVDTLVSDAIEFTHTKILSRFNSTRGKLGSSTFAKGTNVTPHTENTNFGRFGTHTWLLTNGGMLSELGEERERGKLLRSPALPV